MVEEQECVGHEKGPLLVGSTSGDSITEVSLGIQPWPDGQDRAKFGCRSGMNPPKKTESGTGNPFVTITDQADRWWMEPPPSWLFRETARRAEKGRRAHLPRTQKGGRQFLVRVLVPRASA